MAAMYRKAPKLHFWCKFAPQVLQARCASSNVVGQSTKRAAADERAARQEASLSLVQRCKNLLVANWRGQLTTITTSTTTNCADPEASKVWGSLVNYTLVAGKPVVWVPRNDAHEVNLLMDDRGSIVVGHTDPPPLVHAWRDVGFVPPRAVLLGPFTPLEPHEQEYVKRRVLKARDSNREGIEKAGAALRSVLQEAGRSASSRIHALSTMAEASTTDFAIYRCSPRSGQFVDLLGVRHEVAVSDIAGAATDPLCSVLAALVEGINQSEARRFALIVFCAVYLQVRAQDAYMFAADRWGFNVLAKVVPTNESVALDTNNKLWKEFRFGFSREVRDAEAFCSLLAEMEKESLEAMNRAQEVDPKFHEHTPKPKTET
ncbi:unnamed protein product [Sphagnum troendelagicum]